MDTNRTSSLVVVGIDGTEDGARALRYAVAEAHRREGGLRIVHVQPEGFFAAPSPSMPVVPESSWHETAAGVVKAAEQEARRLGYADPHLETVLSTGPRGRVLVEESRGAGCLVLGSRSAPLEHLVAGSTTTALAAHSTVPVICVPRAWNPENTHGHVVAGTDSLQLNRPVELAFDTARERCATIEVLHAWRPTSPYDAAIGSRALADAWAAAVRTSLTQAIHSSGIGYGVEWSVTARYERPLTALFRASQEADLLVVGRHGHAGPHALLIGSVTRALLHNSHCPVMVVPTTRHGD